MTTRKYEASGVEAEFEPGSRNRVLRNLLGIAHAEDMEMHRIGCARDRAGGCPGAVWAHASIRRERHSGSASKLAGANLRLGRRVPNRWTSARADFSLPMRPAFRLSWRSLKADVLQPLTPCVDSDPDRLAAALAEVHAELILIHPFRDGNGRLARLLAVLMARQAGVAPLDFRPLDGSKRSYIGRDSRGHGPQLCSLG